MSARARFGLEPDERVPPRVRRQPGGPVDQHRRPRRAAGAGPRLPRPPRDRHPGPRDGRGAGGRGRARRSGFTVLEYVPDLGDALAASISSWPARARRCSSSPRRGGPRSSSRIRMRRAATSTRTPSGWRSAGAAVVVEDADLDGERVRELAGELLGDRERLSRMGAGVGGARHARRGRARSRPRSWRRSGGRT